MTSRNNLQRIINNSQLRKPSIDHEVRGTRNEVLKKVLILGLGSYPQGSGVSAALYFARTGHDVLVADQKTKAEVKANYDQLKKFKNVKFHLGGWRVKDADWADLIVKNPGVRRNNEVLRRALKSGKLIENDITIFLKKAPCPTIGVTGTRGKTTVTAWIGDMLERSLKSSGNKLRRRVFVGGNITVSPLTFLSKLKKDDIAVVELSSWLLETTGANGLSPHIAVWTNVMNDHLNTYDGLDDYAEAKAQIMRHQGPEDIFVANLDDEYVGAYAKESAATVFGFSKNKKKDSIAWIKDGWLMIMNRSKNIRLVRQDAIGLGGQHNAINALAAAAASLAAGATLTGIRESLKEFGGVPYRQQVVGRKRGLTFVNDTTSTTPDAAIVALQAFCKPGMTVHWICGGADKGLDYSGLMALASHKKLAVHLLVGTAFEKMEKGFKTKGQKLQKAESLKQAFDSAVASARKGDVILLSPACASFGLFRNEFDRGDQFNALVRKLR
jgi:UDP-N-acetylmuramoylalanine--D-glutamate ligase